MPRYTSDLHGSNSMSERAAAMGSEVFRKKVEITEGRVVEDFGIREGKISFK